MFAHACVYPSRASSLCLFPQLQRERSLGGETARRLSEKENAVRELTKRLREAEKAAVAAKAAAEAAIAGTRLPTGARQVLQVVPRCLVSRCTRGGVVWFGWLYMAHAK